MKSSYISIYHIEGMTNYYVGSPVIRTVPNGAPARTEAIWTRNKNYEHCRCPTGLAGTQCTDLRRVVRNSIKY